MNYIRYFTITNCSYIIIDVIVAVIIGIFVIFTAISWYDLFIQYLQERMGVSRLSTKIKIYISLGITASLIIIIVLSILLLYHYMNYTLM